MTGNLKALGLALAAAVALGAVAAQAAQAQEEGVFSWSEDTTTLTTKADPDDPSQLFTIEPAEGLVASFTCDEVDTPAISVSEEEVEKGATTIASEEIWVSTASRGSFL